MDQFYYENLSDSNQINYNEEFTSLVVNLTQARCFTSGTASIYPKDSNMGVNFAMFYMVSEINKDSIYIIGEKINPLSLINEKAIFLCLQRRVAKWNFTIRLSQNRA